MTTPAIVAAGGWMYLERYGHGMKPILTTDVFDDWLARLRDPVAVHRIQMRIDHSPTSCNVGGKS